MKIYYVNIEEFEWFKIIFFKFIYLYNGQKMAKKLKSFVLTFFMI